MGGASAGSSDMSTSRTTVRCSTLLRPFIISLEMRTKSSYVGFSGTMTPACVKMWVWKGREHDSNYTTTTARFLISESREGYACTVDYVIRRDMVWGCAWWLCKRVGRFQGTRSGGRSVTGRCRAEEIGKKPRPLPTTMLGHASTGVNSRVCTQLYHVSWHANLATDWPSS